jgi:formylglycine-generating enzyme required for sulfatase activity
MVSIPAGDFTAGSSTTPDANPPHQVHVNAFAMDVNEVTVAAYDACVCAGACNAPPSAYGASNCNWRDYNLNLKTGPGARGDHPVNCIDWTQASAYCQWAGKRLPTEDEWEYAARGADGRVYPWGNTPPTAAQACWNRTAGETTCPVGSFPDDKSPLGVHDLAGNAAEWTSTGDTHDIDGKPDPAARVFRGGSWYDTDNPQFTSNGMSGLESARRIAAPPAQATAFNGFRCAR